MLNSIFDLGVMATIALVFTGIAGWVLYLIVRK